MTIRLSLLFCLALAVARAGFPHPEATIAQLQEQMSAGRLTSAALTAAYLERIAAVDRAGPALNAIIELNPDAAALTAELDAERKAGRVRGSLPAFYVLGRDGKIVSSYIGYGYGRGGEDPRLLTALRAAGIKT